MISVKNDYNDYDFVKEKFDNDGICTPSKLSENRIMGMLNEKPKLRLYKRKSFKAFVSAAACLVLAVGIFATAVPKQNIFFADKNNKDVPIADLKSFESYEQIQAMAKKHLWLNEFNDTIKGGFGFYEEEFEITTDLVDESFTDSASLSYTNASHGQTYTQVDGVDEGDVLKNDGKYIYYVTEDNEIVIYEGNKLVSTIDTYSYDRTRIFDSYMSQSVVISDLYVNNNRLIVNSGTEQWKGDDGKFYTQSDIYDLTDITAPKLLESFKQDGNCKTITRMIGSTLYVITNTYMYDIDKTEDCYINISQGEEEQTLSPSSIYHCDSVAGNNYVIISSIDTDKCERSAQTKAFYGCVADVYCSKDNLYLSIPNKEKTEIIKAQLGENEIKFTAKGEVNGYINNQFSMDERNGYFRIATSDSKANNLYVLDSNLKQVGKVTGFAENEEIQAVKYIGDMAYVITYEFTDPLFVIDLSDPESPSIMGSVEITGFSSQLVQVDENTILGIGQDDSGCDLKLALFDVSDPVSPKVLDSIELDDVCSNAQYNHKAILVNKEQNYFAFDYTGWYSEDSDTGAAVVTVENNKINVKQCAVDKVDDFSSVERVTYVGDTIYALDSQGNIYTINN